MSWVICKHGGGAAEVFENVCQAMHIISDTNAVTNLCMLTSYFHIVVYISLYVNMQVMPRVS